ncbi:hypothetical protein [Novosphingobium sp. M1R2S20]|uniref:Uncharacterized protein n=1 Tax=Novosphingobium rhizovicinum TaxID=3228928 RepID=A0ABV3REZ1_9SPHN
MKTSSHSASTAQRQARIEAALAQYRHVDSDTLAELLHWFRKEASAWDVGNLASNPHLNAQYQKLKSDHLDRLSGVEIFWAAVVVIGIGFGMMLAI